MSSIQHEYLIVGGNNPNINPKPFVAPHDEAVKRLTQFNKVSPKPGRLMRRVVTPWKECTDGQLTTLA